MILCVAVISTNKRLKNVDWLYKMNQFTNTFCYFIQIGRYLKCLKLLSSLIVNTLSFKTVIGIVSIYII